MMTTLISSAALTLALLGPVQADIPAKYINTAGSSPEYVTGSAKVLLGTVILFNVQWEGHGTQRIIAGCNEYNYGMVDISDVMYTAEPDSEMFDLITEACGDVQWI